MGSTEELAALDDELLPELAGARPNQLVSMPATITPMTTTAATTPMMIGTIGVLFLGGCGAGVPYGCWGCWYCPFCTAGAPICC